MSRLIRPLCFATFFLTAWLPTFAAMVTITSPKDYQVYQRETRERGEVRITGTTDAEGKLEYRLVGMPLHDKLPDAWQPLKVEQQTGAFRTTLQVPAGGWYRVEVRAVNDGKTVAEASVEHVGVGEVFIIAGQSNSANSGEKRQQPTTDRVASYDGANWVVAKDPQPGASGDGGSFIPSFGDAMVKAYDVPIGVVCIGVGGTSVREWLPKGDEVVAPPTTGQNVMVIGPNAWACTGDLFNRLAVRVRNFGPHGFRAVLWHQGESDAKQPAGAQHHAGTIPKVSDSRDRSVTGGGRLESAVACGPSKLPYTIRSRHAGASRRPEIARRRRDRSRRPEYRRARSGISRFEWGRRSP